MMADAWAWVEHGRNSSVDARTIPSGFAVGNGKMAGVGNERVTVPVFGGAVKGWTNGV